MKINLIIEDERELSLFIDHAVQIQIDSHAGDCFFDMTKAEARELAETILEHVNDCP